MARKKCPGGHFILGFCVRGDTFRGGDTICYDTGTESIPADRTGPVKAILECILRTTFVPNHSKHSINNCLSGFLVQSG